MAKDFERLVNLIQSVSDVFKQHAFVVINRNVTARAWLTGYYIVEYEQNGEDRAKYGDKLLKSLSDRLDNSFSVDTLKRNRKFYQVFPEMARPVHEYISGEFEKGDQRFPNYHLWGLKKGNH